MARLARLYAQGITQLVHIELHPSLFEVNAVQRMYEVLHQEVGRFGAKLHAWLFLEREIYLVLTPSNEQAIPKLVQQMGRSLSSRLRSGAVFKRRYRSTLVQSQKWVLPVIQWVEMQASQGGKVLAEYWQWSSVAHHIGRDEGISGGALSYHMDYWNIGNTPFERQQRYFQSFQEGLSSYQKRQISQALKGQWVLGDDEFLESITPHVSRRMRPAKRGRPPKSV